MRQEGGVCGAGLPAGAALKKAEVVRGCTGRDVFSAGGKTLPCARCCPNPGWEGRAWLWYLSRVMLSGREGRVAPVCLDKGTHCHLRGEKIWSVVNL